MMARDRLEELFFRQRSFQKSMGINMECQETITINAIALIDEVMETLRETPWKPWKKQQQLNNERMREELVDALHFFINLCLTAGMSADDLYEGYMRKNRVNYKRQKEGY